jgi:tight adherence protein C
MTFAIIAFTCAFFILLTGGLLLFNRETGVKDLATIIGQGKSKKTISETLRSTGSSLRTVVQRFERVIPKSQAEVSVAQQRLIRAGYRNDSAVSFLYSAKVLTPLALCAIVFVTGLGKQSPFVLYAGAAGFGYLLPDFWLSKKIKSRQAAIRLGLPDVLDMLVICVEAGLGLDQATARTAQELGRARPALSDEFGVVVLEQRAGCPRSDAWKHLAERTDVDTVRNLVSMLVQTEKFGTSIAKTLRTHSETLRTQRIQQVEEMAAKTTIKLIFPLVLFIFPCLFVVTLGPAVIVIAKAFTTYLK